MISHKFDKLHSDEHVEHRGHCAPQRVDVNDARHNVTNDTTEKLIMMSAYGYFILLLCTLISAVMELDNGQNFTTHMATHVGLRYI